MRVISAPSASTSRSSASASRRRPARAASDLGFAARVVRGETAQFHHVRNGGVEFARRAPACACRRLRNRSGRLRKPAPCRAWGRAGSRPAARARKPLPRSCPIRLPRLPRRRGPRQCGFGVGHPDQALGGEQRKRTRIVQDFGQRNLREIVPRHGILGIERRQRLFDPAALVGLRPQQQRDRGRARVHAGQKLRGCAP